jgi:GTP-binding protein
VEDFKVINKELASFTEQQSRGSRSLLRRSGQPSQPNHPLADKPMIVAATKIDSANPEKLKKLAAHVKRKEAGVPRDFRGHGRGN